MVTSTEYRFSTYFLGVASLALSAVGLLLFFMPVLGIPLASVGLLFALAALLAAIFNRGPWDLRWAVMALLLASLALGVNIIIDRSPLDTAPHQVEPATPPPAARVYVSPPAQP